MVVEGVRLDLLPLLTSTQAQLTVVVDPDVTVLFAPKNLRSVVVNLLSNAFKYHRPGLPLLRGFCKFATCVSKHVIALK